MNLGGDNDRPRFLTDENFNSLIVAGLLKAHAQIDIQTVQAAGLSGVSDPLVLDYARARDRILLSHDVRTMPLHFAAFYADADPDKHSPGVFLIQQTAPVGGAIVWLLEVWEGSRHDEWRDLLTFLP
jgi:uncharacterized protein DUF5615